MPPHQLRATGLLAASLALSLALVACSGDDDPEPSGGDSPSGSAGTEAKPAPVDFEAPASADLAGGVSLGDQSDQSLVAVAAGKDVLVAVGSDASYNTTRPLFVTSTDGGKTWSRGTVADSATEIGGVEYPSSVAAGPDGFVAVGGGADPLPVTWTSPDGVSWTRQEADSSVFQARDSVSRVRFLDGTYYLVGSNGIPHGKTLGTVVLWSSEDGVDWSRTELTGTGVDTVKGRPSGSDVALLDDQLVVAGGIEDNELTDQPNRIAVWRSGDQGKTWSPDPTANDFAGDFRAYVRDLGVYDGRLVLTADGDGTDEGNSWDAVIMTASGRSWTKTSPAALGGGDQDHAATLVRAGKRWVLGGYTDGDTEDARLAVGTGLGGLRAISDAGLRGPSVQQISGAVATGGRAVLVGSDQRSGSSEARVWRLRGRKVTRVKLPEGVTGGRPSAYVVTPLATKDGYVALGSASDSPVAWSSPDFGDWAPTGLAGRTPTRDYASVSDADVLGGGDVVAVGYLSSALGGEVGIWVGNDGSWQLLEDPAFGNRDESGYGSVQPTAVAVGKKAVVVAGNAYVNGQYQAHPLVSSPSGRDWDRGVGRNPLPVTSSDAYFHRTPYPAFRAPANGSLRMGPVAALRGGGFVIGGQRAVAGRGEQAVVWSSADGRTWGDPAPLPRPPGAYATGISQLTSSGRTLVAAGGYRRSADETESGWVSWVSTNGGKSWRIGKVVAKRRANVSTVVTVPGGFLALGSTGPSTDLDAAAWTSTDGRTWQAVELDLARGSGPGNQYLTGGIVDGDRLRLVGGDVPPAGGGYYAATVDLPSP